MPCLCGSPKWKNKPLWHSIQDCPENKLCDLAVQKLNGTQTDRIVTNSSDMFWGKEMVGYLLNQFNPPKSGPKSRDIRTHNFWQIDVLDRKMFSTKWIFTQSHPQRGLHQERSSWEGCKWLWRWLHWWSINKLFLFPHFDVVLLWCHYLQFKEKICIWMMNVKPWEISGDMGGTLHSDFNKCNHFMVRWSFCCAIEHIPHLCFFLPHQVFIFFSPKVIMKLGETD